MIAVVFTLISLLPKDGVAASFLYSDQRDKVVCGIITPTLGTVKKGLLLDLITSDWTPSKSDEPL
jgi:hypothetical protein